MDTPDFTEELCSFAAGLRFASLPPVAVSRAAAAFADTIGCVLAGMSTPTVVPILALAIEEGGAAQATIFGTTSRVPATAAALVNGMAGHSLDFDDISPDMYGHPGVVLVPALFAAAEKIGASGEDVICAYAAGFEVAAAIGKRINPAHYDRGWHATATIGSLAAAAAVARLLDLPAERMQHALGIAAAQAAGLRRQFGTDVKSMHAGLAARAGVQGADLAARGMKSDRAILDGPGGYFDLYSDKPAAAAPTQWQAHPGQLALVAGGLQVKRHACCAATHTSVDAVLGLIAEHRFNATDIAAVECRVSPLAADVLKYVTPRTPLEGKFSLQFCVSVAAHSGDCGIRQFTQARVDDADVRDLASRVVLKVDSSMPPSGTTPSRTSLLLRDGRRLEAAVQRPKGSPDQPFTRDELRRKFMECAGLKLLQPESGTLFDRLLDLAVVPDMREIAALLRTPAPVTTTAPDDPIRQPAVAAATADSGASPPEQKQARRN